MKHITLRPTPAGLHFSTEGLIPWARTNLPAADFRFNERAGTYWEVEMLAFYPNEERLHLRVTDYEAEADGFLPDRKMKQRVSRFTFEPLDEAAFKAQLSYYRAGALSEMLRSDPPAPAPFAAPATPPESKGDKEEESKGQQLSFAYPIMELTFANGGVKGEAELPGLVDPVSFKIINDHIVAEFDNIKPFFVKALKRQTIRVSAELVFRNDEPALQYAASPQIARIDDRMLELFRGRAVKSLLSPTGPLSVDKSLFTPDDIFDSLDDDALGKAVLPRDDLDLLALILSHRKVRNARQLEFLSGRLHEAGTKLRYVLSPDFGFVFTTTGQDARHFVLELLDSHATYVWSIPKTWETPEAQNRAVEREIAAIGTMGRSQYRRTLHFEHAFWFVVHEAAEKGLVDGFPRWKNRLLEGLV